MIDKTNKRIMPTKYYEGHQTFLVTCNIEADQISMVNTSKQCRNSVQIRINFACECQIKLNIHHLTMLKLRY